MRPVCNPSSSTDSSSSAESRSTSPSPTADTSSASRDRIASSRAIDCTVCASASATSRASPFSATPLSLTVVSDQRAQLVLEPARFDRAVDPALLRGVRLPPPAPGAEVLALFCRPCAGRTADRGVALVVEGVVGQLVLAHVVPHFVLGPFGERVELHDRAVVVVDLDLADVTAGRPLVAPQAGDPRVEPGKVPLERQDLPHLAAEQPVLDALVEEVRPETRGHPRDGCRARRDQVELEVRVAV